MRDRKKSKLPPINTIPLPAARGRHEASQPLAAMTLGKKAKPVRKLAASVATPQDVAHQVAGYPQRRRKTGAATPLSWFLLVLVMAASLYASIVLLG